MSPSLRWASASSVEIRLTRLDTVSRTNASSSSVLVLSITLYARYGQKLAGYSRWTYVVTAMLAFYLNVFVLVVQLFQKVPAFKTIAPTQIEPSFKLTQLTVLVAFAVLTIFAAKRSRNLSLSTSILQRVLTSV